jgi:hypothetical protein
MKIKLNTSKLISYGKVVLDLEGTSTISPKITQHQCLKFTATTDNNGRMPLQ